MTHSGVYRVLLEAGAQILPPARALRRHPRGLIADGETVVPPPTATRRPHGRRQGKIYIASPLVAACSALEGILRRR
ncbi:MAG: hypothetical protein ACLVL7_02320 [Anaerotruncus massiliensis (ex Togo et al. 2019)]